MARQSIQDRYAPGNACFGCGPSNPDGLQIKTFVEGDEFIAEFTPEKRHEAFDGVLCGGIIGTLLDCQMNWAAACKGEAKAVSPFEYAAPLTETMLLGIAALRAGQGRKLTYDAAKMTFSNAPDADQYLTRQYRGGWSV